MRPSPASHRDDTRASVYSGAAGLITLVTSLLVLAGWHLDVIALKSVVPGLASMKYNTALALAALGLGLYLARGGAAGGDRGRGAMAAGLLALSIGALTVIEWMADVDLGIDQLIVPDSEAQRSVPGRMAVGSAIAAMAAGGGLVLGMRRGWQVVVGQTMGLVAAAIGLLATIGYLFDVTALYGVFMFTSMALHSSVLFVLAGCGVVLLQPSVGVPRDIVSDLAGGHLARRLLVFALGLLGVLAVVRWSAEPRGLWTAGFGAAFMATLALVCTAAAAWTAARWLNRSHASDLRSSRLVDVLSRSSRLVARDTDRGQLLDAVCGALVDAGLETATISLRRGQAPLQVQARAMQPSGEGAVREWPDIAAAEARAVDDDEPYIRSGKGTADGRGLAAFPIRERAVTVGALTVSSPDAAWFTGRDAHLLAAVAEDISLALDRQAAEDERASVERLRRMLFEAAPVAMVMVDRKRRIVLVNRNAEMLFQYAADEMIGKPIETLLPERFHATHTTLAGRYQEAPEARAMGGGRDLFAVRRDGSEVAVEVGLNPFGTGDDAVVVASVVDISTRKRWENELRRSNEELERFAYVASHDLQEPLRAVAGCAQILKRRYAERLDAGADELIGHIVDGAERMEALINGLLHFARIDTKPLPLRPTSSAAAFDLALRNLATAVHERQAVVTRDDLPTVWADPSQLVVVFQNLVANAIKFTPNEAPRVHVGAQGDGDAWHFVVEDHGIGIAAEHHDRIFQIFQRLHTRREYRGTGLGLAVVKRIIERHGGRLWVESVPGQGSRFFFSIPGRHRLADGEAVPVDVPHDDQRTPA